jgi:hypothetical protein
MASYLAGVVEPLEQHLYDGIAGWLGQLTRDVVLETYVVSLSLNNEEDDPRKPYLYVRLNTEQQVARTVDRAGDLAEAKWNAAYWQDEPFVFLLINGEDPNGGLLRREWIEQLGLGYTDEQEEEAELAWLDQRAGALDEKFEELMVGVVRRLHADGVVKQTSAGSCP